MTDYLSIVREQLKRHEGLKLHPYHDIVGKLTIGYGRNLDDNGITIDEAEELLSHDITTAVTDAMALFPNFHDLSENRKAVIVNMSFELGKVILGSFRHFREAIAAKNFAAARDEMLNSQWAKQVPNRVHELSNLMEQG